jgi:transposase
MNNGNQQDKPLTPAGTDSLDKRADEPKQMCPHCGAEMPFLGESPYPCCRSYMTAITSA